MIVPHLSLKLLFAWQRCDNWQKWNTLLENPSKTRRWWWWWKFPQEIKAFFFELFLSHQALKALTKWMIKLLEWLNILNYECWNEIKLSWALRHEKWIFLLRLFYFNELSVISRAENCYKIKLGGVHLKIWRL